MTGLARELQARPRRRYSYRFLFIPGTIGSITWLALNDVKVGSRPGGGEPRRSWGLPLQEEPQGKCRDRPRRARGAQGFRRALRRRGVRPLRLRRAAVLLAGLQPGRGLADPDAVRPISRVPHLGGQPGFRAARGAGGVAPHLPRGDRRARREPALPEPQPQVRAPARPPGALPDDRRRRVRPLPRAGPALGSEPLRRGERSARHRGAVRHEFRGDPGRRRTRCWKWDCYARRTHDRVPGQGGVDHGSERRDRRGDRDPTGPLRGAADALRADGREARPGGGAGAGSDAGRRSLRRRSGRGRRRCAPWRTAPSRPTAGWTC